ncbi:hypothetical protein F5X68DRAFT_248716 [Plectosphaerella plurivora]|uniref:Aminoglycoside phosphotransferase domain-containing protein n=1 Tax=Plectosphaerella plurivora TaxID=936078 RepID=A0A9P8VJ64_9PEZI|nr:hypothetical protein F5X68DRAFT_248716 [Plectosphaerella plurivora]
MAARQDSDGLALDRSDEIWEDATKQIEAFATRLFGKPATLVPPLVIGGFNVLYPLRINGLPKLLARLPCPGQAVFPEEKTVTEASTAACISQRTAVPIPRLFGYGNDPDVGPYMIIQDLDPDEAPRKDPNDTPILRPDIPEDQLQSLYAKLAGCMLQLAQPTFPRIGALVETSLGSYEVLERPFSLNMNNMVQLSNIPPSVFPSRGSTYGTADEWYTVLAEMHMATLLFQHNDMVSSTYDCRNKYVARQIFRRLAPPDKVDSFRLWSDDFRPTNVLVDDKDDILGAIDWEYAYVGPAQFVLDPPWWLLLDVPEMWDDGIDDWARVYEGRLQTWLAAMEEVEGVAEPGSLLLSAYMRESWATGRFWLNYAARKSWAFDTIYWKYLDEKFFGQRDSNIPAGELWKTRVELLTEEERAAMEVMVDVKMEESRNRVLVEWDPVEAKERLCSFLFD